MWRITTADFTFAQVLLLAAMNIEAARLKMIQDSLSDTVCYKM